MPGGLGFCTSEYVRCLLRRGLAVLAKTEWSWYTICPLGLFSAASRGTRKGRCQRVENYPEFLRFVSEKDHFCQQLSFLLTFFHRKSSSI